MTEPNLAGNYTLKVSASVGDGTSKNPGDVVSLSHEDAKRFLEGGMVVDPTVHPERDPHDSADHILSKAEFLRWMECQYPRYVEDRLDKRERNRIVDQIRRGDTPSQDQMAAVAKEMAPPPDPRVEILTKQCDDYILVVSDLGQKRAEAESKVAELEARIAEERATNEALAEELRAARQPAPTVEANADSATVEAPASQEPDTSSATKTKRSKAPPIA